VKHALDPLAHNKKAQKQAFTERVYEMNPATAARVIYQLK